MVSIIAGLLRSIAAICRICAAGSAPPAAGLGIDAGTAAGCSVTSVITGLETAALAGICIRRQELGASPQCTCLHSYQQRRDGPMVACRVLFASMLKDHDIMMLVAHQLSRPAAGWGKSPARASSICSVSSSSSAASALMPAACRAAASFSAIGGFSAAGDAASAAARSGTAAKASPCAACACPRRYSACRATDVQLFGSLRCCVDLTLHDHRPSPSKILISSLHDIRSSLSCETAARRFKELHVCAATWHSGRSTLRLPGSAARTSVHSCTTVCVRPVLR